MKSIILPAYNKNIIRAMLSLGIEDVDMPQVGEHEVLVKTHAAPVNPSDIAFIQGSYNIKKTLPAAPGFEASGKVVATADSCKQLLGKKISAFVQDDRGGSWAEYFVANKNDLIVLDAQMDMDQAACFTVNPFTAYGLFEIALMRESKAILQNASGGQTAAFIRKMAEDAGMAVIDIVRKEEVKSQLMDNGAKYVLLENDESFEDELISLCKKLEATTAFDAVGGPLAGSMFNAMPADSELVCYGGLSGKAMSGLDTMDVIFDNKIISGFNLMDWKAELEEGAFESISMDLQKKFINHQLSTDIQGSIPLEKLARGLKSYISNMSGGKVLIKP